MKLKSILLVDDDEPTNILHKRILEKAGAAEKIEVAYNGEEALRYFDGDINEVPDLVFLDINMPKVTGWDFLETYKNLPPEKKAKGVIVMLTTSLNPDDREKASRIEDIREFIGKPLSVDQVMEIIEKHFS